MSVCSGARDGHFFKYRPLYSEQQLGFVLEVITEQKLFLSPTRHFTDPFDAFSHYRGAATQRRVLSLSAVGDSTLLWALYGGWYSGVMIRLRLNLSAEPFAALRKVRYTKSAAVLQRALHVGDVFTKHIHFAYEGEWRLVFDTDMSHIDLPRGSVASVTLGPSIREDHRRPIAAACRRCRITTLEYECHDGIPVLPLSSTRLEQRAT
jgi:hypothetical protein